MKNIELIRCYGARFDPENFRGKGVRGWWIRCLNRLRFWVECRVIYHVLIMQAKRFGELADLNAVLREYQEDVQRAKETHFKQPRVKPAPPANASVEGHLKEMHRQGALESPRELTARILARYAADTRSRRYAHARGRYVIYETEETVDAADAAETHGEETPDVRPTVTHERKGRILPISPALAAELDSTEAQSALARERLRSAEQIRESIAAAEEHQRSVLS